MPVAVACVYGNIDLKCHGQRSLVFTFWRICPWMIWTMHLLATMLRKDVSLMTNIVDMSPILQMPRLEDLEVVRLYSEGFGYHEFFYVFFWPHVLINKVIRPEWWFTFGWYRCTCIYIYINTTCEICVICFFFVIRWYFLSQFTQFTLHRRETSCAGRFGSRWKMYKTVQITCFTNSCFTWFGFVGCILLVYTISGIWFGSGQRSWYAWGPVGRARATARLHRGS